MEDPDGIVYIPAKRGGFHLRDKCGYKYFKAKTQPAKDRCYWSCLEKKELRCAATAVTVLSTRELVKLCGEHCHGNKMVEDQTRAVEREQLAIAASMPTVAPRTVLGEIATQLGNHSEGSTAFMRSSQALARDLQRKRLKLKGYPMKPKSFDDMITIPKRLTETAEGEPFLVLNDTVEEKENSKRILVFMSKFGRDTLATCSCWHIDGTFKAAASTLYAQIIFIIGLSSSGRAVPCGFALVPDKEKTTYIRLAECIKTELRKTEIDLHLTEIMMDFEKGLLNAFSTVFEQAQVVGCDFHWKSCLRKRLMSDGLMAHYNADREFHKLVR
jgi:hypothetical protein